jgi:hypothetical protein
MNNQSSYVHKRVATCGLIVAAGALLLAQPAAADQPPPRHAECLKGDYCLCVTDSLQATIEQKAKTFRDAIHAAHSGNRLAIYLSVPLSGSAGAYFALNREVANDIADGLGKRFGAQTAWILNPATPDADLPKAASQADYMYLWSRVLYDAEHSNDGVDLVYFAGPSDFSRHLRLSGTDDLTFLGTYFDHRVKTDPDFAQAVNNGKVKRIEFLSYYGFRASVSFSAGAHDEWNLVSLINAERRAKDGGIIRQLPVFFDGSAVAPSLYNSDVPAGNVGQCKQ